MVTELNDLVMHRALTPAQLAVFIAKSFPCRPTGFAIIDTVASSPGATLSTVCMIPGLTAFHLITSARLADIALRSLTKTLLIALLLWPCRLEPGGCAHQASKAVSKVYQNKGRACWTALGNDATTGTSHNKPWDATDRIILLALLFA